MTVYDGDEGLRGGVFCCIEVDVQHGILLPFLLQFADGQPIKQLFPSLKVGFQRGDKQALAEPAGTADEIVAAVLCQLINILCFINIEEVLFSNFRECLYADRVFHNGKICGAKIQLFSGREDKRLFFGTTTGTTRDNIGLSKIGQFVFSTLDKNDIFFDVKRDINSNIEEVLQPAVKSYGGFTM